MHRALWGVAGSHGNPGRQPNSSGRISLRRLSRKSGNRASFSADLRVTSKVISSAKDFPRHKSTTFPNKIWKGGAVNLASSNRSIVKDKFISHLILTDSCALCLIHIIWTNTHRCKGLSSLKHRPFFILQNHGGFPLDPVLFKKGLDRQ